MESLLNNLNFNVVTNILLGLLVLYSFVYMLVLLIERRKRERLLSLHIKKNSAQKLGDRFKSMQRLYKEIEESLAHQGHDNIADIVFYAIIVLSLIIFFAMALTGQYVLAIVYPFVFIWFIRKIMTITKKDPIVEMEEQMPMMLDNMIRVFSKYSDIKSIIFETSLMTTGPIHEELDWMSRQMNSKNPKVILEEFSEKHDSVWLNNFGFTLIGYLQDSSKEETIRNLRHLRTILERENTSKKNAISERKPSLMVNYALCVIGVVLGVGNLLFNKVAFDFFFHSYTGLFCFTGGFGSIMATIYMNIKMMQIKK